MHEIIEKRLGLLIFLILVVISFGGLTEIVPLFFQKDMTDPIKGLKPYSAVKLEGRDVYIREGCHVCHTQMIRPFRAETERYGHYSVAGEHVFEHPFLWGSKRTGPDLARVGGRYSDAWHKIHLYNPRDVVPESKMPAYPWLRETKLDLSLTKKKMVALSKVGVPYTEADFESVSKVNFSNLTEEDALVEYLQSLGTLLKSKR
jgi:cytochrome c oxidase cbb3-type subunit 2